MPRFVPTEELFKGRHFEQGIVVLCVRWYLSFKLSFRDLIAMMDERGICRSRKLDLNAFSGKMVRVDDQAHTAESIAADGERKKSRGSEEKL